MAENANPGAEGARKKEVEKEKRKMPFWGPAILGEARESASNAVRIVELERDNYCTKGVLTELHGEFRETESSLKEIKARMVELVRMERTRELKIKELRSWIEEIDEGQISYENDAEGRTLTIEQGVAELKVRLGAMESHHSKSASVIEDLRVSKRELVREFKDTRWKVNVQCELDGIRFEEEEEDRETTVVKRPA